MLYQAIRLGSTIYHCDSNLSRSNEAYRGLLKCMDHDKWSHPSTLDKCEVRKVRDFVNVTWRAKMQATPGEILPALRDILPHLNKLRCKTIMDVSLDEKIGNETIGCLIGRSFDRLATCRSNDLNESTAASKILHVIYPDLFLMWDRAIRCGYGGYEWIKYADFLQRMQRLANLAVEQVKDRECRSRHDAIESLRSDCHSLAKTLDEYNYVKFTLNDGSLWKKEYEL